MTSVNDISPITGGPFMSIPAKDTHLAALNHYRMDRKKFFGIDSASVTREASRWRSKCQVIPKSVVSTRSAVQSLQGSPEPQKTATNFFLFK